MDVGGERAGEPLEGVPESTTPCPGPRCVFWNGVSEYRDGRSVAEGSRRSWCPGLRSVTLSRMKAPEEELAAGDGMQPFVAGEKIYENASGRALTVTMTIHNPGPDEMTVTCSGSSATVKVKPGSSKAVTFNVENNGEVTADKPGSFKLDSVMPAP